MENYLNNDCISIINKYLTPFTITEFNDLIIDFRDNVKINNKIITFKHYKLKIDYSFPIICICHNIIISWQIHAKRKYNNFPEKYYFSRLDNGLTYILYTFFDNILDDYYGLTYNEKKNFYILK